METVVFGDQPISPIEIVDGEARLKQALMKRFPGEKAAIEEYYMLAHKARDAHERAMMIKSLPLPIVRFLVWTGLHRWIDKGYHELCMTTVREGLEQLTSNKELQAILSYNWGDYGCEPARAAFVMQLLVSAVFLDGGYYPRGGPSVIPNKIIKQILMCDGKVLVNAPVKQIILNKRNKVMGVEMKGGRIIPCKVVVSDAGFVNTATRLLPPGVIDTSSVDGSFTTSHKLHSGASAISLFIGLKGSWRSLNLPESSQYWIYASHDTSASVQNMQSLSLEDALEIDPKDLSPIFVGTCILCY